MGTHWEILQFVVILSMTEAVIWGLAWLDKWGPTIWWERGCRRLCIGVGPRPSSHESEERGVECREREAELTETGEEGPFPAVYNDLAEVFSEQ